MGKLFSFIIISIMIIISAAATGCKNETTKPTLWQAKIKENTYSITISTDKETYQPGETVQVTATVENLTDAPVSYWLANSGDPFPSVSLQDDRYSAGVSLQEKDYIGGIVVPVIVNKELKPHEIVTREVVWDQKLNYQGTAFQAPAGTYQIVCGVSSGVYDSKNTTIPTQISLAIQIAGAPVWITPDQAKAVTFKLPDISAWVEAHSGKNITKTENGKQYLLSMDSWIDFGPGSTITFGDGTFTFNDLQTWVPSPNIALDKGSWRILLATKLGLSPHTVQIWVDPVTSAVKDIQYK